MEYTKGTKIPSMPGWEIVRELGSGSYGTVFEVQKKNFDVTAKAALKMIRIPKSNSEIREAMSEGMDEQSVTTYFEGVVKRYIKEIAVMSELKSHPNIVACEDYQVENHAGNIGWDILIRMELLTTLTNYQLKNPMNEETVKRLAIDICEALVFCQKKGLIHRDIKPANILVDQNDRFKLGDFGGARTLEQTIGGYSKQGTEYYMAPEVYLGRPYGATVDLYSLGLVLYRLMNGNRLPFYPAAPKPIELSHRENALAARMRGDVMPPPCNASEEFAAIILKACAYNSKDRYRTAAEMLEALKILEKKSSESPSEQKSENETDGPKGKFVREYYRGEDGKWYDKETWVPEGEEGSIGSIGVDFGKIKKEEGQTTEADEKMEDSAVKADDNIDYKDEESIGSIGIVWGKKKDNEATDGKEEKTGEEDILTPPLEELPEEKKGISFKIAGLIGLAAVVVIGVSIWAFGRNSSKNQTSTETTATYSQDVQEEQEMSSTEENAVSESQNVVKLKSQISDSDVTIDYEKIEQIANPGKNQVNREELSDEETILFDGRFLELPDMTDEKIEEQFIILKNRLDVLGVPYAIGHLNKPISGDGQFTSHDFAVRISPERMGYWICELLEKELILYFPEYEENAIYGDPIQSFEYRWDGEHWVVTVSRKIDTMSDVYTALSNNEKMDVILNLGSEINEYVLSRQTKADVVDFTVDGYDATVTYEMILDCFEDEANQGDYEFVLELMKMTVEEPSFEGMLSGSYSAYCGKENELEYAVTGNMDRCTHMYELEYGISEDDRLLTEIHKVFPNARVGRGGTGCLNIILDDESSVNDFQDANGNYDYKAAEKHVLDAFQKTFQLWDFSDGSYEEIYFYTLLDESKEYYAYQFYFRRNENELRLYSTSGPYVANVDYNESFKNAVKEYDFFIPLIDSESPLFSQ